MQTFVKPFYRVSRLLVWIGGTLILGSALLVTVEVLMRKFLNISLGGADEISGYAFAVATAFGFAFALFERAHIRVDALLVVLPQPVRLALNIFGLVLLIGFATVVVIQAWSMVGDTLKHGSRSITPLRTPLALPQIPWLIGWVFFILSGLVLLLASLQSILRGEHAEAEKLIGTKSIAEQIEDETA